MKESKQKKGGGRKSVVYIFNLLGFPPFRGVTDISHDYWHQPLVAKLTTTSCTLSILFS